MRIALAGNPNSGKTTMYNALTGCNEKVGNWAGVTVEKKEHPIKRIYAKVTPEPIAVDLPGAYSMSPFTSEESITAAYIKNEHPDVIINIVDVTNLSRSLFFTTQLLEMGIPMVVALNKSDVTKKRDTVTDTALLSKLLGCKVVETVSTSSKGMSRLIEAALSSVGKPTPPPFTENSADITDKSTAEAADRRRFDFVNGIVRQVQKKSKENKSSTLQDKADVILTSKWTGLPIFAIIMFLVFWISQATLGTWIAEGYEFENGFTVPGLVTFIDMFGEWVGSLMENAAPILRSVIVDGIIGGVGAVIGFLPLIMIMYFLISLLEDCGYMARATVVLDPIFKKVGLSGKSVIPFIIGTGCAVPGIMACRTIRDERERKATAMIAPFMPCGAKLPIISLFAGVFFSDSWWVGPLMYFIGIAIILFCALLINLITGNKNKRSFFIIELPEYKAPSLTRAAKSMGKRGLEYIVKAGTIILICNFAVQLMQSFNWRFQTVDAADSILHDIATPFAFVLAPIVGIIAWQLAAAAITGFIAKENVVGTLAVCFVGLENLIDKEDLILMEGAGAEAASVFAISKIAALAYLLFNLFSPPCFAAIGAMNAEIDNRKWFWSGIALQLGVGYSLGFLVFFVGTLFSESLSFDAVWMPVLGWTVVLAIAAIIAFLSVKQQKAVKKESQKATIGN